jgi:hypothetical protein
VADDRLVLGSDERENSIVGITLIAHHLGFGGRRQRGLLEHPDRRMV